MIQIPKEIQSLINAALISVGAGIPPPNAPANLAAVAGNAQVTLTWDAVSGASSYNLYRSLTTGAETLYQSGVTSGYLDTGVVNGTAYYYKVTAVAIGGESSASSEVNATPTAVVPRFSIVFDGSNDYIDCGNGASLNLTSAGSFGCWLKVASVGHTNKMVMSKADGSAGRNGYLINYTNASSTTIELSSDAAYQDSSMYNTNEGPAPDDGLWWHLFATWDGSNVRGYVNGVLTKTTVQTVVPNASNVYALMLGRDPVYSNGYYKGKLFDPRVYSRKLSDAEVLAIYQNNNPTTTGLQGWWKFTEGSGTSAADSSGNANTGTLINGPLWDSDTPY